MVVRFRKQAFKFLQKSDAELVTKAIDVYRIGNRGDIYK
jgi:hypothetical protein